MPTTLPSQRSRRSAAPARMAPRHTQHSPRNASATQRSQHHNTNAAVAATRLQIQHHARVNVAGVAHAPLHGQALLLLSARGGDD